MKGRQVALLRSSSFGYWRSSMMLRGQRSTVTTSCESQYCIESLLSSMPAQCSHATTAPTVPHKSGAARRGPKRHHPRGRTGRWRARTLPALASSSSWLHTAWLRTNVLLCTSWKTFPKMERSGVGHVPQSCISPVRASLSQVIMAGFRHNHLAKSVQRGFFLLSKSLSPSRSAALRHRNITSGVSDEIHDDGWFFHSSHLAAGQSMAQR